MRLLALVTTLALTACGTPCVTGPRTGAQFLCASDGGISATLYNESGSCSASADGGTAVFTTNVSSCTNTGNNPVVFSNNVPCDVSALPPGTYTTTVAVTGGSRSVTFTVPLNPDAGFSSCL
jgi:hypothetical protein